MPLDFFFDTLETEGSMMFMSSEWRHKLRSTCVRAFTIWTFPKVKVTSSSIRRNSSTDLTIYASRDFIVPSN